MALCPLCARRPGRRFCPARGDRICTVCCATKRRVEIACPDGCVYLQSAERHPPAVVRRQQSQDLAALMGAAGHLDEAQLHLFIMLLTLISSFIPPATWRPADQLLDQDVANAAGALASTYETASRGVIYEQRAVAPAAEALRHELQKFCGEARAQGGSRFERDAATVLRTIEHGAKHEVAGLDEGPRSYLELLDRVLRDKPLGSGFTRPLDQNTKVPKILLS